jgi:hypothetical protein
MHPPDLENVKEMIFTMQGRNINNTDVTPKQRFSMDFSMAVMRNSGGG